MALITRQSKGSKLSIAEMDGNLTYLEELAQQGGGGSSGPQGPEGQSGPQGPEGGSGGGGFSYYNNGNSSQNTEIDWSRASLQKIAIDNNPTLSFTGATAGQKLTLLLKRLAGESKKTITWSDGVFWRDGEEFDLKVVGGVSLDEGFNIGDGFNDTVYPIALQPDGKILVGGFFTSFDGDYSNSRLVRLNADGTLDTGFDIGDGFNSDVSSIVLQPDGGILVGGDFTEFDGNTANFLVRLNADGSIDTGFGIGTGFNDMVLSIVLQPDGGILVGGDFTEFDGFPANRLVRLNPDGTRDSGFDIGTGFNIEVYSIVLQPDGGILVGGRFTSFDGDYSNGRLVRLNADGTLDSGFDIGDGFNGEVFSIAVQPDGGILVGGGFTEFDGNSANRLARLNPGGTLDTGFGIGDGFNDIVFSIALQPDGGILAGGFFTSFDGDYSNSRSVRLNADGTLDTGFDIGDGFNSVVLSITLQPDGGILVGGDFTSFDGNPANRLARLVELSGNIYTPVNIYYTGDEYIGDY
jgi:uncharacterized delta-60 repeat protein